MDPRSRRQHLNGRQEIFARELAIGKSQAAALRIAYPAALGWKQATVHSRASRLAATDKVYARVAELTRAASERFGYTRTVAIAEVDEALALARKQANVPVMLAAIKLKARIAGLLPRAKPVEPRGLIDDLSHEDAKLVITLFREWQRHDALPQGAGEA